jgi:sensor histidine kinase YesM
MRNWLKPTRTEWITFFVLMPVIDIIALYIMFGERIWTDIDFWLYSFWIGYAVGLVTFYLNVIIMHRFQQLMPELRQTPKRITLIVIVQVMISTTAFGFVFWSYDAFEVFGFKATMGQFKLSVWIVIGMVMLTATLWESEFIYKKYKESIIEKETMQQLSIQQEFESLKSQVNPHFLFNCFNTLSSLIGEDKEQAEVFLNELSKVYRYLLRNNEDGLSTLQEEMNFIKSFYRLLKTRHGDAIQLQIEVDKKYFNYLLPSLSLQLLVENAVKHNVTSKDQPLVIDIFSMAGNKLAVNNNLQPKVIKAPSNKIGLSNIRSKYELLKQDGFQVLQDARNFTVVLPMIWNNPTDKNFSFIQKDNPKNKIINNHKL